ncbi:MAG TPA: hypothetical protein VIH09_05930 [Flavobacterium sp.]
MRKNFFAFGLAAFVLSLAIHFYFNTGPIVHSVIAVLLVIGFTNTLQRRHAILINFPVLGYFRCLFEAIAPEIQQYFIERTTDNRPFSRNERSFAYERAKNIDATTPFGTQLDINQSNYEGIRHSV